MSTTGTVSAWRGRSLNLSILDDQYGSLYIDLVRNNLPARERIDLFGATFSQAIDGLDYYVVVFMSDPFAAASGRPLPQRVVPRTMTRGQHLCRIYPTEEFLCLPLDEIVTAATALARLCRREQDL